jgi:hypothetical protein
VELNYLLNQVDKLNVVEDCMIVLHALANDSPLSSFNLASIIARVK